jgi:hypothetical protein
MKPVKSESVCKQASVERVGRNEFSCLWGLAPESAGDAVIDDNGGGKKGRGIK